MKSIKSLPSFAALALCLSVSSMASAATITPVNSAFTAPGTISVSSPASLNLPVTCNITFKGKTAADGSYASIDSVTVSGSNTLCSVPQMTGLPWKLTVSSTTAGKVDGVGFKILSSTCGPSTVNGSWSNATNTLSASNQSLARQLQDQQPEREADPGLRSQPVIRAAAGARRQRFRPPRCQASFAGRQVGGSFRRKRRRTSFAHGKRSGEGVRQDAQAGRPSCPVH